MNLFDLSHCIWKKMKNIPQMTMVFVCFTVVRIDGEPVNIALNKPATHSSTIDGAASSIAENAVDGDSNGNWNYGSCSHTDPKQGQTEQWWMVDLQREYKITNVHIVNRQDAYSDRLRNFVVETFLSNPEVFPASQGSICVQYGCIFPASDTLNCTKPLIGRFVKIKKLMPFFSTSLMLCEVKVMVQDIMCEGCPRIERVYKKTAAKHLSASSATTNERLSVVRCALECLGDGGCQAFQFNDVTSTCVVIRETWETDAVAADSNWNLYFM